MLCLMFIGQEQEDLQIGVTAGTAFTLLASLAVASRSPHSRVPAELAGALGQVGDGDGEAWLNLLGVPLDAGAPYTAERLVEQLRSLDGVELRRHLLGRFSWSWCSLAGIDDIEAAARGDGAASGRLLAHPRYYGGHAAASLGVLLRLEPEETRTRLVRAVEVGIDTLLDRDTLGSLDAAERAATQMLVSRPPLVAIERLTTGYRYVPEPEAESITLVPHLEPELPLLLAQHRSSRLIAFHATVDRGSEERLNALGKALADPRRVEILALVGRGVGGAHDLVAETGLSRSTVHHHLALLRDAGLVALEGNARAYTYVPRPAAAAEAAGLVADIVGSEEES
jgi:DNA-binding transcriptional ArsR family regulator